MCERCKSLLMFLACFYLRETSYILILIFPLTDDFPPPASGKKKTVFNPIFSDSRYKQIRQWPSFYTSPNSLSIMFPKLLCIQPHCAGCWHFTHPKAN